MSGAVPHYVRVVDASGQPARLYDCESKRAALDCAREAFRSGFVGAEVAIFEGRPNDNVERDPVKVWS